MVNLELYKVFCAVAKKGSLTKASEELFISQPAVSSAIKQLEKQLGGKLFTRTRNGMELTENGKAIYLSVKDALNTLRSVEEKFAKMVNKTGSLKICASDTVFNYFLLPFIKEYHKNYPSVKLQLISCTSTETLERLENGTADIGFINLPVQNDKVLLTGVAMTLHDGFFAGDKYFNLANEKIPLSNLQDYPLLMLEIPTVTARAVVDFALTQGVQLVPEIELGSLELATASAVNNMGIACIPKEFVKKEIEDGKLKEIVTEPPLPARAIGIALPKNGASDETSEFLKIIHAK